MSRVTTRLEAPPVKMNGGMISPNALQAMRLSDGELPIVLSALETNPNSHSVEILKGITIKMFETHRGNPDSPEVFRAQIQSETASVNDPERIEPAGLGERDEPLDEEDIEWKVEAAGEVFLMKPERPKKARNAPGSAVSAQKGGGW